MKTLISLLILLSLLSCTRKEEASPVEEAEAPIASSGTIKGSDYPAPVRISKGEAPFQIMKMHSGQPRNLALSPLSLKMALEMVYPMAGEQARLAMETGFGFTTKESDRFKGERDLAKRLGSAKDSTSRLLIANSIWLKEKKNLRPEFLESLHALSAEVHTLDLKEMNQWVKSRTEGRIPVLLETLDPKVPFLAVNTLYFKGSWTSPFRKNETANGTFRSSPSESSSPMMMRQVHSFKYHENEISKWLELPYKDSPLAMILVLPKKDFDLKSVEARIDATLVDDTLARMKEERVELVLPKFKVNEKTSLKNDLSLAGYGKLFTPGEWKSLNPGLEFSLGDVIQAVSIDVDEEGTTAAAATALTMETTSFTMKANTPFHCDQPFLFLLTNRESHEIYFMGRIHSPE